MEMALAWMVALEEVIVNEAYFLGGIAKEYAHIFFDDQASHLSATSDILPSVHVPFGQLNHKRGSNMFSPGRATPP